MDTKNETRLIRTSQETIDLFPKIINSLVDRETRVYLQELIGRPTPEGIHYGRMIDFCVNFTAKSLVVGVNEFDPE